MIGSDPLRIFNARNGKVVLTLPLPLRGVSTTDLYDVLNRAVAPYKVLLFSRDGGKPSHIYHKPRAGGGNYDVEIVPVYPAGSDPYTMINQKLIFKAEKRASRVHNSRVLAAMVGTALYNKSPVTFMALANDVLAGMEEPAFWGGQPRTELQMAQLTRHLSADGPNYRAPPYRFKPSPEQVAAVRANLSHTATR